MKELDDIRGKAVFSRLSLLITIAVFCGRGAYVPSAGSTGSGGPYGNTPAVGADGRIFISSSGDMWRAVPSN